MEALINDIKRSHAILAGMVTEGEKAFYQQMLVIGYKKLYYRSYNELASCIIYRKEKWFIAFIMMVPHFGNRYDIFHLLNTFIPYPPAMTFLLLKTDNPILWVNAKWFVNNIYNPQRWEKYLATQDAIDYMRSFIE